MTALLLRLCVCVCCSVFSTATHCSTAGEGARDDCLAAALMYVCVYCSVLNTATHCTTLRYTAGESERVDYLPAALMCVRIALCRTICE